jgi:NAD(P)-dependent dehydrogenase (short-subunit alcohol dehydrogenase family)
MKELADKVAFITGGASGIGLELARGCAESGMNVMLADIDEDALSQAIADLKADGLEAQSVRCDVTDVDSIRAAAQATTDAFGKVHLLANNAGVFLEGGAGDIPLEKWRWVIDVNFTSVVYGVEVFLPLMRSHGEGGHILNTASMAGLAGFAGLASYVATKHAVFGYSESIAGQLESEGIGVSVLCPGFVNTRIADIARYEGEGDETNNPEIAAAVKEGMSPEVVAKFALEQIQRDALHIFTHSRTRGEAMERYEHIAAAFDRTEASEIINSDPDANRVAAKEIIEDMTR